MAYNYTSNMLWSGSNADDSLYNYGDAVTIDVGNGDDSIYNYGENVSIVGGDGEDVIFNLKEGVSSTITGGADDDWIGNSGSRVSIHGGEGKDFIYNYEGYYNTISGGDGDDSIENENGSNITIYGAGGNDYIVNQSLGTDVAIEAGAGNDSIVNSGNKITVGGGAGADEINNNGGENVTLEGGAGDDSIQNNGGKAVSINGGEGNDVIDNKANVFKNDNTGENESVLPDNVTITGGEGNDLVSSESSKFLFQYKAGDGNDTVLGFNENSTLSISDAKYSSTPSGLDMVFTVGDGSIILKNAAALSSINVLGEEISAWRLNDKTATYGTSKETLITVNGVKDTVGLSLSGITVTVVDSALNFEDVTINNGYNLALGEDVKQFESIAGSWALTDAVATYTHAATVAGYRLAENKITYEQQSGGGTFTVNGVKDTVGLSLSGITVTVADSALNFSTMTISDGYKLALGDDVEVSTTKTGWSKLENGNTAYQTEFTTAGYSLANNQINYLTAVEGEILAELSGIAQDSTPTLNENGMTLTADNFANNVEVVNSKIYNFELATNDYAGKSFTATENADKITNAGSKVIVEGNAGNDKISNSGSGVTINGGAGDDNVTISGAEGGNTYVYSNGDGKDIIYNFSANDKIQIRGTTDIEEEIKNNDAVFKVGKGTITVKDATTSNMKIALINSEGETISENQYTTNGVISGNKITLSESLKKLYMQEDKISIVDGSKVKNGAQITGNSTGGSLTGGDDKDTLTSGAGNFELTGGAGKDLFVYGGGNDTINDYTSSDKISLGSFDETDYSIEGNDIVLNLGNNNALTIKNGKGKDITFADKKSIVKSYADEGIFGDKNKSLILSADTAGTFSADKLSKLVTIDGSQVDNALQLIGNKKGNLIIAGNGNTTLNGGKGKDTLVGGDGDNVFIYDNKSGNKVIQNCDEDDLINLGDKAEISQVTTKKGNVILKVGSNTITIEDVDNFNITENGETKTYDGGNLVNDDSVTLGSDFKGTFNLDDNDDYTHVNAELGQKAVNLIGDAENNSLIGGKGKDSLSGGGNKDTLNGGKGNDSLWGGDGADTFVYQAGDGSDYIFDYDFESGDVLQILDKKGNEISKGAIKKATFNDDDLTLAIKGGGKVILAGIGTSAKVNVNGNTQSF